MDKNKVNLVLGTLIKPLTQILNSSNILRVILSLFTATNVLTRISG